MLHYPENWRKHSYIAMNGVYENAVLTALETHSNLNEIVPVSYTHLDVYKRQV